MPRSKRISVSIRRRKSTSSAFRRDRSWQPRKRWRLRGQVPAAYKAITFILAGNPNRVAPSGGGISTQIPIPITIPGVLTLGGGVLSAPTPTHGPKIIDVTNQGDPFANFNLANPLAIVSGFLKSLTGDPTGPHRYTNTVL